MMSERPEGERGGAPRRILSIEEEIAERNRGENERGERPFFEEVYEKGDRKLVAVGTRHVMDLGGCRKIKERYDAHNPDVVVYEGRPIKEIFPGLSDEEIKNLPAAEVAKRQEQAFLAWTAFCEGRELKTWDPPMVEQLEYAVVKKHSIDAIEGCIIAEALEKIYMYKISPTPESFEALLGVLLLRSDRVPLQEKGFNFSYERISTLCKKYVGKTIEELQERWADKTKREEDISIFRGLSDPAYRGETNDVSRDINVFRDRHAVRVIEEAKKKYKTIFILGGGSHIRTWRPALKEMYT